MAEKKYFVLQDNEGDTETVFCSRQARGAALKAASRGLTTIKMRERGTNRVHVFQGWREEVATGAKSPSWLGDKVWKANVKKQGIERI